LETNRQNVSENVEKWQLNEVHAMELTEANWDDWQLNQVRAMKLTEANWNDWIEENDMAFVTLFAPWCVWCQRLAPTWEEFAHEIKKENMPIGVGKVDCVAQASLCRKLKVMALPSLRWYHAGEAIKPDYKMDRTVQALVAFAKRKLEMDENFKECDKKANATGEDLETRENKRSHPACQVSGQPMVNRVPGNFHIKAKSTNHNLNSAMTNLSHVVNHLSFGDPIESQLRKIELGPMDNMQFLTKDFHQAFHHYIKVVSSDTDSMTTYQAFHHYIKVVSTHLHMGSSDTDSMTTYQSQIVNYDVNNVPEARFSFDFSPMVVVVEKEGRS
jgi:thiol-disulfide isomerase/thioredoxin